MCQQGFFQGTETQKRRLLRWRLCAHSWTSCEASESATQPRSCWKLTATTWCATLAAHYFQKCAGWIACGCCRRHAVFCRLSCEAVHECQRNLITVFYLLLPCSINALVLLCHLCIIAPDPSDCDIFLFTGPCGAERIRILLQNTKMSTPMPVSSSLYFAAIF